MLKYNGINYNLDCLLQFEVLKQLLEALAKKQLEYDAILFGANISQSNDDISEKSINIDNSNNNIKIDNNRKSSENNYSDIAELIDLYGLKDGIKKNNELILSLTKRIEYLEKKPSYSLPIENKDNSIKTEIIKSIDSINKVNKENFEKIHNLEEKINQINNISSNFNEKNINITNKNKEELMDLIYKNKDEIQKNMNSIEELKKSFNEYINSKINQMKYNINVEINKKLDDLNDNHLKNLEKYTELYNEKFEQINKKIKEQEQKLFSIEETNKKKTENFLNEINSLKLFRKEQKSTNGKIYSEINSLKLINESFNNNIREINDLLRNNTFQTLLSDLNNISNKIVDIDEYRKTIDLINLHLKELQSDNNQYRRYFEDIIPLIGKISTSEDLKKLEELLKTLLEEQNSNAQKKYADKSEILQNIKKITKQIKMLTNKYDNKNRENSENCMLASKPISKFRCASCENIIENFNKNTQYLPWNKFPIQEMIIKPYRLGNGFSHFLQNIILDKSSKIVSNHSDDENNNKLNLNNISTDKIKRNKNVLPIVNDNILIKNKTSLNNVVEIKAHFNTERSPNINNKDYINSYFTKTVYNNENIFGNKNKLNCNFTKGNKNKKKNKRNIFTSYDNNLNKTNFKDKKQKKIINVKNINNIFNIDNKEIESPNKKNEINI